MKKPGPRPGIEINISELSVGEENRQSGPKKLTISSQVEACFFTDES